MIHTFIYFKLKMNDSLLVHNSERWNLVSNLDLFLENLYFYYVGRGFMMILMRHCLTVAQCVMTGITAYVFIFGVNWSVVHDCTVLTCSDVSVFETRRLNAASSLFIAVFCVILLVVLFSALKNCSDMHRMRDIYRKIQVSDIEIRVTDWNTIVTRVVNLNRQERLFISDFSADDLNRIIMRKENMMIALVGAELIPHWLVTPLSHHIFLRIFLDVIIDPVTAAIRDRNTVSSLMRRIRVTAIAIVMFWPFLVPAITLHTFLMHAAELKNRHMVGMMDRNFTYGTAFKFRKINELPHEAKTRLNSACCHAKLYLEGFPTPVTTGLVQIVHIVFNSCILILLTLSLLNEDILIVAKWNGLSLFACLAIATVIATTTALPSKIPPTTDEMKHALTQLCIHLHNAPMSWTIVGNNASYDIRRIFVTNFEAIVRNTAAVIVLPILFVCLSRRALDRIFNFLKSNTALIEPQVGVTCSFPMDTPLSCVNVEQSDVRERDAYDNHKPGRFPSEMIDAFIESHLDTSSSGEGTEDYCESCAE